MSSEIHNVVKQKSHRERHSGRKAEKKKAKTEHEQILTDKQKNPKAFTFNSAVKAERRFRRKQDIDTKKQHIPLVDRTSVEPPPILVAVVGPPKVGKTLLIQCLVKSYVRQPLTNIIGPVTVVSGKKRRITFMECNNDINSMIDIAKVADLVLLLVDASFGFEMEVFEFLNICQVHGMPRIMGVLTHLDLLSNAKQLRKTKKSLKTRFWTEVYAGAKLFYLSGLMHNEYLRTEVKNLARFISVMKYRPLTWRTTHPYLLADRIEDLTAPELVRQNPKVDRTVSLYGYIRGVPLNKETSVHIPGCGDLKIKDVSFLPDPCPLPEQLKKRSLVEKERLIYAPFSGVGGIVYDKDAVYVELAGSHSHKEDETGLISSLMETQETLDEKLQRSEMKMFSDAEPIKARDVQANFASGLTEEPMEADGRVRRKVIFDEEKKEDNHQFVSDNESDSEDGDEFGRKNEDREKDNEDESSDEDNAEKFVVKRNVSEIMVTDSAKKRKKEEPFDTEDLEKELASLRAEGNVEEKLNGEAEPMIYRALTKDSDILVKEKITQALGMLSERATKIKESKNNDESESSEDESFDELSDNDATGEPESSKVWTDSDIDMEDNQDKEEDEDSDDGSSEEHEDSKWKTNIESKARASFDDRRRNNQNLMKIVYGVISSTTNEKENERMENEEDNIGGIFRVVSEQQRRKIQDRELKNREESVFFTSEKPRDWLDESNKLLVMNRFVTGKWKESEDAEELLKLDDLDEDEVYGDFKDLETGELHSAAPDNKVTESIAKDDKEEKKKLIEKKRKLKEQFDLEYDNNEGKNFYEELKQEAEKQSKLNKSEFESLDDDTRVQLEGFRPGMYVRVEIEGIPCELVINLDPTYPLIIGGLLHGEENIGYVQARIKKHRWHSKILKTRDPLILSVGWRRFQTIPIYSKLEDDMKNRMLKYTPEHIACMAHFWGPVTPQSTGILAIQDVATRQPGFRIAATGSVIETDKTTRIVKKLKLTGVPMKIYKKTAFIKDMFNSSIEVAKFEGARIKTVSGIRGQIKKAVSKPEGCFRATFEDKIKLSDIVFCRTWYKVDVPKFYNPVNSLLLPLTEKAQWRGMRTTGQLKRCNDIKIMPNKDSLYQPIVREPVVFKPLVIPRKLQKNLPYKDKPKLRPSIDNRQKTFESTRVAVVREPKDEKIAKLMKMIRTSYGHKQEKLKDTMSKRMIAYKARVDAEEMKKLKRQKEMKKQVFRQLSKMEAKEAKKRGR